MKQFLLTATFLLFTFIGFGQCDIPILSTQSQIDNFPLDYPGCTSVYNLRINGPGVTDLSPLSQITSVEQQFYINETMVQNLTGLDNISFAGLGLFIGKNNNLTSLNGLGNLEAINGNLGISENQSLTNLEGLESLTEIVENINGEGGLSISLNSSLTNLSGLENLTSVFGDMLIANNNSLENIDAFTNITSVDGLLQISQNTNLMSLSGLSNLQSVESLLLYNNDVLSSLDGLESLNSIDSFFGIHGHSVLTSIDALLNISSESSIAQISIFNNSKLSECDIIFICERINDPSVGFQIENNNVGCNSREEIQIECGVVDIPDTNFLNALLNHNPVIDTNDDDLIQFDEAEAFTGTLEVAEKTISDFTGLEAFVNITGFDGGGNFIDFLSLQNNTALSSVDFSGSPDLEAVNLKNGNNTAITSFNAVDCPSLDFICVDDVPFAEANFTNVDPQVQFVADCEFLSVPAFNLEEAVTIFPNPVSETLTISIDSTLNYVKAEIYSVNGQKLKESSAKQVEMGDLSAGIYFVKVISEEGTITKKIVKQ